MAASDPVSSTRLYLGNLPRNATKQDVENHFASHGGKINEIKLMNGFGFIEFEDELDARDIVPTFHGSTFMGERLTVQFAKGSRREAPPFNDRPAPRPRRTPFRMTLESLPAETSWQDLKDFARQSGLDVVYSEVSRDRDGRGFVEYETMEDLRSAVDKLDQREFKGTAVHCISDPQDERTFRDRQRSRSPRGFRRGGGGGGGYPPGPRDDYDYRGPPRRGYSPQDGYRRRSPPPPRDYYGGGGGGGGRYDRSPPRGGPRGPPDYPPRGRYADDGYGGPPPRGGPRGPAEDYPPRGRYDDGYGGAPPRGGRPPYEGGYDRAPR